MRKTRFNKISWAQRAGAIISTLIVHLPVANVAPRNLFDIYLRYYPIERGRVFLSHIRSNDLLRRTIAAEVVNIVVLTLKKIKNSKKFAYLTKKSYLCSENPYR